VEIHLQAEGDDQIEQNVHRGFAEIEDESESEGLLSD
jgi:hypothetical protein